MKKAIKDFWYWYSDAVWATFVIIIVAIGVIFGLLLAEANTYKFNCKLDHRPDLYTTAFIADTSYAYDPEFFCNQLKQEMHK